MTVSLENLDDSAFVTVEPGVEKTPTHDVSAVFNFEASGEGNFHLRVRHRIEDRMFRRSVDIRSDQVTVIGCNVEVNISGDVGQRDVTPESSERAFDSRSNTSGRGFIDAEYSEGESLALLSASYINSCRRDSLFSASFSTSTVTGMSSRVIIELQ